MAIRKSTQRHEAPRRRFKRGDLVFLTTATDWLPSRRLYVVYRAENADGTIGIRQTDPHPEHPSFIAGGGVVAAYAPSRCLQLVAAIDSVKDGPSCDDLINFIVSRGPARREEQ